MQLQNSVFCPIMTHSTECVNMVPGGSIWASNGFWNTPGRLSRNVQVGHPPRSPVDHEGYIGSRTIRFAPVVPIKRTMVFLCPLADRANKDPITWIVWSWAELAWVFAQVACGFGLENVPGPASTGRCVVAPSAPAAPFLIGPGLVGLLRIMQWGRPCDRFPRSLEIQGWEKGNSGSC